LLNSCYTLAEGFVSVFFPMFPISLLHQHISRHTVLISKFALADAATDILCSDSVPVWFTDGGSSSFHL